MKEELQEIIKRLNSFSEKYKCRVDIDVYECRYIGSKDTKYQYKATIVDEKIKKNKGVRQ